MYQKIECWTILHGFNVKRMTCDSQSLMRYVSCKVGCTRIWTSPASAQTDLERRGCRLWSPCCARWTQHTCSRPGRCAARSSTAASRRPSAPCDCSALCWCARHLLHRFYATLGRSSTWGFVKTFNSSRGIFSINTCPEMIGFRLPLFGFSNKYSYLYLKNLFV